MMGTFMGHLVPGACFIFWGVYILITALRRYLVTIYLTPQVDCEFHCHPSTEIDCGVKTPGRRSWWLKITFIFITVVGIVGEAITGFDSGWNYHNIMNNIQHIFMFTCYGFHLVCDLVVNEVSESCSAHSIKI